MTDEERIRELYRIYWDCMIRKDAEGLRAVMAKEYSLRHMTGIRQTREEFISELLEGTLNYYSADHEAIEVRIDGKRARMTGRSWVVAAVYGGGKHRWRLQGDFTLIKENDRWKLTGSSASTY